MSPVLFAAKGGNSASQLYTLDPVTGAAASVGSIGYAVTGLAFDPTTSDHLYASTSNNDPTQQESLLRIVLGAGPSIVSVTLIDFLNGPNPDLGFDAAGQLFGWMPNAPSALGVIDKATAIEVGHLNGINFSFGAGFDINRAGDGKLYAFPKGGTKAGATNTFNANGTYYYNDMVAPWDAHLVGLLTGGPVTDNPAVAAVSFDGSGVAWAILNEFGGTCYLVTIDVATGAVSSVATLSGTKWDALCWSIDAGSATADFSGTPTTGYAPLSVAFTDLSTGSPVSWAWDFGDGGTSILQNPTHVYAAAGVYTVSLTVDNGTGPDTKTEVDYITVYAVDFSGTPREGPASLSVAFTDLSTGSPVSWAWDFGDGGTSTAQNPTHAYTAPGVYDVTLTVAN